MAKFDSLTDSEFKTILNSCATWKELGEKLGYNNTLSSNLKDKILKRCSDLNIEWLNIVSVIPIKDRTKHEVFLSNKTWQSARSSIRRDAYNNFIKNTDNPKCIVCGYDKHVEVAHIKAVSEFSDDALISEINDTTNLVGLCPNHHWEYDNELLNITPYLK